MRDINKEEIKQYTVKEEINFNTYYSVIKYINGTEEEFIEVDWLDLEEFIKILESQGYVRAYTKEEKQEILNEIDILKIKLDKAEKELQKMEQNYLLTSEG